MCLRLPGGWLPPGCTPCDRPHRSIQGIHTLCKAQEHFELDASLLSQIDPHHKSHNASDKYPTRHHFVHFCKETVHCGTLEWCIMGFVQEYNSDGTYITLAWKRSSYRGIFLEHCTVSYCTIYLSHTNSFFYFMQN